MEIKKSKCARYISVHLLVVGLLIFIMSFSVFADNSLTNKESKNKFDYSLVSYLQNESQKRSHTSGVKATSVQTLSQDKIPVIITLYRREDMFKLSSYLNRNGANIKFSFELIDAIAVDIPSNFFESLASNEYVKQIYLDRKIQLPQPDINFEKKIYYDRKDFLFSNYKKGNILDIGNVGVCMGRANQ